MRLKTLMMFFSLTLFLVACDKENVNVNNSNANNENVDIGDGASRDIIESTGMPSFHYLNQLFGRTDLSVVKEQLSKDGWDYKWTVDDHTEVIPTNDSSFIRIYVSDGQSFVNYFSQTAAY